MSIVKAWFAASIVVCAGAVAQAPVADPPKAPLPPGVDALAKAVDALPKPGENYGREVADLVEAFPTFLGSGIQHQAEITIEGPDEVAVCLTRVAKSWAVQQPQCAITVRQRPSVRALASLAEGRCDLALVARTLGEDDFARLQSGGGTVHQVAIARDGVAIYVHCDNPLAGLTLRQCNAIFAATHSMTPDLLLRWTDIDPASPLGESPFPLYLRDMRTDVMQRLAGWCMPGEPLTTIGATIEPSSSSVVNACCAYRNAMGVASTGAAQVRARIVPLSAADGGPFILPTVSNIINGSYPLARSLSLVVVTGKDGSIPQHVVEFLRFLWSEDGQDVVGQSRLIPADPTAVPPVLGQPTDGRWR
jgi:phosphate transport system substrate-binding protein